MSGPFQRPPLHTSNSSTSSPLSPQGGGDTPVSFRTNVNRAKTKRWVEAKKYTYDGDDWGEDEYGEYEYDDEPPVPQLPQAGANRSNPDISSTLPKAKGSSHSPLPSMDRSRSMEHTQTESTGNLASPSSPETPIVRPAEIYKRMREEQKATSATSPPTGSVGAWSSEATAPPVQADTEGVDTSVIPPATANEPPTLSLPDVKRLSGFGSSLLTDSDSNPQINQDTPSQQHELQHNPSLGFRSAVNQAFDVPETPSTIADSVARSNSDSTTGVSPIIARHGTTDDKTPTIHEEPNENAETPTDAGIVFKPGHRRDLSIPSPGNSPSRRPQLAGPETSVSSELAQLSGATPAESPLDYPQSSQQGLPHPDTALPSRETPVRDLPPPLNVQTSMAPGAGVSTENIPVIIPSMSSDNSPEDTENDRLRKEIIRSLSRENTPSDHQDNDTPPQTSGQDTLFPHKGGLSTVASQVEPASSMPNAIAVTSAPIEQPAPIPAQNTQPKLKKRFSWEESSDEEDPTPVPQSQPARPMPGQFPFSQENVHPESEATPTNEPPKTLDEAGSKDEPENAGLTALPPLAIDTTDISSSGPGHEPTLSETLSRAEEEESYSPKHQVLEPSAPISSTSVESGLLGFKDILGKQSPDDRIQAFDQTRDQFAAIDTGLSNWVQVTLYAHPEHADVVERNSKPLSDEFKNSLPRAKFPKLSSLGNLASSLQDGSHSTSGHIRRPSATLGSVRQNQAGKDFLHTAGVLGGHAGKAAKGLFSKGRSKLKGVGGSEKGFQSSRGYHRPVRLSDLQPDPEPGLDLEDTQDLHDPPASRPWMRLTNQFGDAVTTRGGEYFFVQPSPPSGQFDRHGGSQRRPAGSSNPCSFEEQGEPHEDHSSHSANNNEHAGCDGVDHLGAKPRDDLRRNAKSDGENDDEGIHAHPVSREELPSPQFHALILDDIPERDSAQSHDSMLPTLHQLPSISSLGAQELDLGPPPPLAPKLAQNHLSSEISLPSNVGDSQPRHLGGRTWRRGQRRASSQGNNNLFESPFAHREAIQTAPARHNGRPASTPGLLPPLSPKHEWSRRPEQISSSRDPASPRTSSSPMEKLKNVGRFHRVSMGSNQSEFKTGQLQKRSFNKLTGLFSRTQHRKSAPPEPLESSSEGSTRNYLAPVTSRPDSRVATSSVSSVDNHERPVSLPDARNTFHGHRAPIEGYFAHESPETFNVAEPQSHLRDTASTDHMRLSDPTPINPGRLSPHSPPYHSPGSPHRQRRASPPRLSPPIPTSAPRTPPSRGRSEDRSYAQDLHLRSRSPKAFAPRPEERNLPKHDATDPAYRLGTFRTSNPRTSHAGDQELPWKITIPGDSDEGTMNSSFSWRQETEGALNRPRLPTYQEDEEEHGPSNHQAVDEKQGPPFINLPTAPAATEQARPPEQTHPHRDGARAINASNAPVELPVRADDDSSEEIMMSSTAYPGQEWRPLGYSEWEHQ